MVKVEHVNFLGQLAFKHMDSEMPPQSWWFVYFHYFPGFVYKKKKKFSNFLMFALDLKAIPPYKDHTEQTLKHQSNTKELVLMLCCLTSTVSPPKGGTWTHSKYYSRRLTAFYGQCWPWPTWCPRQDFHWRPLVSRSISQSVLMHSHRNCMSSIFVFF